MEALFPEIKKNFGFGCMRLPLRPDGSIDIETMEKMVDMFLERGFNYFDTAHVYHKGKSETTLKEALTSRYPRSSYILTDKLTSSCFRTQKDIRPFVREQLDLTGAGYFDFYLMHSQSRLTYDHFQECGAYETAFKLKEEGLVRHVGISFHDKAWLLDKILTEHPEIEIVQIQFNYADWDSALIDSKNVYETARRHGKPVIVMEPVKGGSLATLPPDAEKIVRSLGSGSPASLAIRWAAGFEGIRMVLSGMSSLSQMEDNLSFMEDFKPLGKEEKEAVEKIARIFGSMNMIPCTACHYCVDENRCPKNISIPELFGAMNVCKVFGITSPLYYNRNTVPPSGKAKDCVKCGGCERVCPQHLPIRHLLEQVSAQFDRS